MSIPVIERRKIALIGFTVSRDDAPWGDPEWELWGCNNLHKFLKPEQTPTGWFDLHSADVINADEGHVQWLADAPVPVWLWPKTIRPEWQNVHPFPIDEIDTLFRDQAGLFGWRYYTNSVSYMIAFSLACLLPGIQRGEDAEIALYGIDMSQETEYGAQRPSCEYWLGVAEGLGVKVFVADRADLLKCGFRYGDDETYGPFAVKMRAREGELVQMAEQASQQAEGFRSQLEQARMYEQRIHGALENQRYIVNCWLQPEGTRKGEDDPSMLVPASDGQQEVVTAGEPQPAEVVDGG